MLKRFLALLLAVMLCPALSARADESLPLYCLWTKAEDGHAEFSGTGVLCVMDDLLLSTRWAFQNTDGLYATGPGGTFAVVEHVFPVPESSLALLLLEKSTGEQPAALCAAAQGLTCTAARPDGTLCTMPTEHLVPLSLDGLPGLLFSAEENLLPGGVLTDADGTLAGIIVAEYAEGRGRYAALSADGIYARLMQYQQRITAPPIGLSGFTVTPQDGCMLVDWSGCELGDVPEDSVFQVYFAAQRNPYYSCVTLDADARDMTFAAVPGVTYDVWILHDTGAGQEDLPQCEKPQASAAMLEAQPFTLFAYQDQEIYLGALPAGESVAADEAVPPLTAITAQSLSDPDTTLYLQVRSTYPALDVQQEAELLFVLTTPEGCTYASSGTFIFDPSLVLSDLWHADITDLFSDCLSLGVSDTFVPGEYTLAYYLDGALGSQFAFTLE